MAGIWQSKACAVPEKGKSQTSASVEGANRNSKRNEVKGEKYG